MGISDRRSFLAALAASAAMGATSNPAFAEADDGHARGHDVAAAPPEKRLPTLPRKSGDPLTFSAKLDSAAMKSTSGGWARETTSRQLPLATNPAMAHLFLDPGGTREMHWHGSSEWAYVLGGRCQTAIVDPTGATEVVNLSRGDLWYVPAGHAHSIQTLGGEPCHALLIFDDGLYGEHGTFGLTDWISRLPPASLSAAYDAPENALAAFPRAETYIMQGSILAADGPEAAAARPFEPARTHRFGILASPPSAKGTACE